MYTIKIYPILFSCFAIALFLRAALFLWIRPFVAALSTVLAAILYADSAFSRSPSDAAAMNFLMLVFINVLFDLFLAAAFSCSLILFNEDLMFATCPCTPYSS